MALHLSPQERSLLEYLNSHCESPDRSGFITIARFWTGVEDAPEGHAKAIAGSIAITSEKLEALVSRLDQRGLVGKKRTSDSLLVWITADGQDAIDAEDQESPAGIRKDRGVMVEVFISHSSKDVLIAERLIDLLRAALNVPAEAIRCTSVPGFKLPVGADTDEHLRREIHESRSFIGLITEVSFDSAYVLFELGARWGANKPLAPLLAAGTSAAVLRGPIGGKNALSCDSRGDLHQLIDDIGNELTRRPAKPASYNDKIERLVEVSESVKREREKELSEDSVAAAEEPVLSDELAGDEMRYLMSLSRPRNRNHVPIGYFDTNPNPKEERYRVTIERFVRLGLMRYGSKTYNFTDRGYERADMYWRIYILKALARLETHGAYVEADAIAEATSLTDGQAEAEEVDRHLRALGEDGLVDLAEDMASLGALITSEGRGEARRFPELDGATID